MYLFPNILCSLSLIIMYIGKHLIFFHEYMLLYVLTDRKCFYSIFAGGDAARVCNMWAQGCPSIVPNLF